MRALSGAIITAAALIGLGLTAQGIGNRYQNFLRYKPAPTEGAPSGEDRSATALKTVPDFDNSQVKIHDLDNPMKVCLTALVLSLLIGLAITFIGLMYHHHRRYHEHLRAHHPHDAGASPRVTV
jgi:hypothetical protein